MKILNANEGPLTNLEVLEVLQKNGAGNLSVPVLPSEREVYHVLTKGNAGVQSRSALSAFQERVRPFNLTRAERLQIVNLRPTAAVEIHLIIEDCDERFTAEQVDQILAIVAEAVPGREPVGGAAEEMEEDG